MPEHSKCVIQLVLASDSLYLTLLDRARGVEVSVPYNPGGPGFAERERGGKRERREGERKWGVWWCVGGGIEESYHNKRHEVPWTHSASFLN